MRPAQQRKRKSAEVNSPAERKVETGETGDGQRLLEILERRVDVAENDEEKKQLLFRRARLLAEVLKENSRADFSAASSRALLPEVELTTAFCTAPFVSMKTQTVTLPPIPASFSNFG